MGFGEIDGYRSYGASSFEGVDEDHEVAFVAALRGSRGLARAPEVPLARRDLPLALQRVHDALAAEVGEPASRITRLLVDGRPAYEIAFFSDVLDGVMAYVYDERGALVRPRHR